MKIGNVELENNIFLAPMAGITDLPFRLICKENDAGLVYTEMVSAKALLYNDEKTKLLLKTCDKEKPLAVQIFGSDVEAIAYASKYVSEFADIVDINMGCPAPKVVKNGDGSRLLLNLELVKQIIETAVANSKVPVTVKMRTGWDADNIVVVEAAKIAEKAGASAITVHGRTRSQYYSGEADWNIIKQVKESVSIPVIGNGDVTSREIAKKRLEQSEADWNIIKQVKESVSIPVIGNGDVTSREIAKKRLEQSGVDAIMIGRGAFGNPWIFRETVQYLQNGICIQKPTNEEKYETILKHLGLEIEEKAENIAVKEMRKHISAYTKSMPDSSSFRSKINTMDTAEEVRKCLKEYFAQ